MANQISAYEVNNFVAGLITEASPLSFPENASIDEQNFVLHKEGSRRRRLGMDYEEGFEVVNTSVSLPVTGELALQSYKWVNAGGEANRNFIVVQVGNELKIFDSSSPALSSVTMFTHIVEEASTSTLFSFTVVDGILVVATGLPQLLSVKYDMGEFLPSNYRLLVRDMFGVGDVQDGVDLRSGSGITTRPTTLTDPHLYNLRNQTWALPRKVFVFEQPEDLIYNMWNSLYQGGPSGKYGKFPSNADVTTYSIYPDAQDADDRLTDRFNAFDVVSNPIGSSLAPQGYFIIDALSRGQSRLEQEQELRAQYPNLIYAVSGLPQDYTPGGATVVAQFAGRAFYTGFSGEVIGGDEHSPRLSSYVLFSKLIDDQSGLGVCYQVGDPTSKEEPDLLDTDGGFLRIDGAYGISALVSTGDALMVVAANGVWAIQGGSDYGFKATNYLVTKITDYGCVGSGSVVLADSTLLYWAEDGIYAIAKNQFGDYVADNLTTKTVQTLYESIKSLDRAGASGTYDSYERKIYWTYRNRASSDNGSRQIVLDLTLGAFYPFVYPSNRKYPMLHSGVTVPPYRVSLVEETVEVNGETVVVVGDPVVVEGEVEQSAINETKYLVITGVSPTVSYTFSVLRDTTFKDFKSVDNIGVDAKSYLITGYLSGGDNMRQKQVSQILFHFNKTEDGFIEGVDGDWVPTNQSSCLVSSRWEWSNNANSGKWGRPFQAYRFKRHYFPSAIDDNYDNGFNLVTSKNKLRGRGRVLSLLIESEPEKDMYLLGWSMVIGVNGSV